MPVSISYISTPRAHQSEVWSCPVPRSISGEMYSGVPQKVFDVLACFASPKSDSRKYPSF